MEIFKLVNSKMANSMEKVILKEKKRKKASVVVLSSVINIWFYWIGKSIFKEGIEFEGEFKDGKLNGKGKKKIILRGTLAGYPEF